MVSGTYHLMNPKNILGWTGFFFRASLRSGPIILETSFLNEDVTDWIYIENKNRQDGSADRLSVWATVRFCPPDGPRQPKSKNRPGFKSYSNILICFKDDNKIIESNKYDFPKCHCFEIVRNSQNFEYEKNFRLKIRHF